MILWNQPLYSGQEVPLHCQTVCVVNESYYVIVDTDCGASALRVQLTTCEGTRANL